MPHLAKTGGIAICVFGLLYLASFVYGSPVVGFTDGDNPATSLAFLEQHADFYFLSGLAATLAAVTLTVAVLAVADLGFQPAGSLLVRLASTFGLFAAAFMFGHGVLRMNSPGTLLYMASLDREWGLSAYLAVQMAGTQGLAAAGIFAFSIWAMGLSLAGWRSRRLPTALALAGVVPALPWLMGLLGRSGAMPDSLWLLYIGSIILGIPLWSIVLGVYLLRWKPAA